MKPKTKLRNTLSKEERDAISKEIDFETELMKLLADEICKDIDKAAAFRINEFLFETDSCVKIAIHEP